MLPLALPSTGNDAPTIVIDPEIKADIVNALEARNLTGTVGEELSNRAIAETLAGGGISPIPALVHESSIRQERG